MKFQRFEALEKHFSSAHPDHLSQIYLLVCPKVEEGQRLLMEVAELIASKKPGSKIYRPATLIDAVSHLNGPSLFGELPIVLTAPSKDELSKLSTLPIFHGHLLILVKEAGQLYTKGKRELVMLDLTYESLNDKETRLSRYITRSLIKEGKSMAVAVQNFFIKRLAHDFSLIDQELAKLCSYTGKRTEITALDVEAISIQIDLEIGGLQLAEQLILGQAKLPYPIEDTSDLLMLVGQLRYVLEQALTIASLQKRGAPHEEYPPLKPYQLEKSAALARAKGCDYFIQALTALFELELAVKRSLASPQLLFDRFCGALL